MTIKHCIDSQRIIFLQNTKKDDALRELVAVMHDEKNEDALLTQFLAREALMSTGIGLGIAVPHIRTDLITSPIMSIGLSAEGIDDYASLDNQPVKIVFMVMVAAGEHKAYIELLGHIASVLKVEQFRTDLLAETTIEGVHKQLRESFSQFS